jgi:hypothetical protein
MAKQNPPAVARGSTNAISEYLNFDFALRGRQASRAAGSADCFGLGGESFGLYTGSMPGQRQLPSMQRFVLAFR